MSPKRYRRIMLVASITGILGASAAVTAVASSAVGGTGGSESSGPGQAQPVGGVAAPDAEQLGAFVAVRRGATAVDQRVAHDQDALKTLQGSQASAQANPSLGRNVYAGDNGSVFLVPGAGTLCLLVSGNAFGWVATCATNAQAIAGGLGFVYYSTAPSGQVGDFTIAGVLPDGARDVQIVDDAGTATPVPLSQDNGYWATTANAAKMTWQTADGTQQSMSLPRGNSSSGG
jgi:hypothetical protein